MLKLLVLQVCVFFAHAADLSPCSLTTAAATFDLAPLPSLHFIEPSTNWAYAFSPCSFISPTSLNARLCADSTPAPAFQVTFGECLRLASRGSCNMAVLDGSEPGVSVSCIGGDGGRRANLELSCFDGPTSVHTVNTSRGPGLYVLVARGRAGCPIECSRDPLTGAVCGGAWRGACAYSSSGEARCGCNAGFSGHMCSPAVRPLLSTYNRGTSLFRPLLFIVLFCLLLFALLCSQIPSLQISNTASHLSYSACSRLVFVLAVLLALAYNRHLICLALDTPPPVFPQLPPKCNVPQSQIPPNLTHTDLINAASACAFHPHHTRRPLVAFVVGNAATTAVASNMLASISLLTRPFCVLVVPADELAVSQWEARRAQDSSQHWRLLVDKATLAQGSAPEQSRFREPAYNRLTVHKWKLALRLLRGGYDAFILDPDLVFLRDPIGFIEIWAPRNNAPLFLPLTAARSGAIAQLRLRGL